MSKRRVGSEGTLYPIPSDGSFLESLERSNVSDNLSAGIANAAGGYILAGHEACIAEGDFLLPYVALVGSKLLKRW